MSIVTLNKYLKSMRGKIAGSEFRKRRNKKIELSQKRVPTRPNTPKQQRTASIYKKCLERYYKLTEEEKRQYIEKYREFNLDAYRAFMKDCLKMPLVIRKITNCLLELHLDEGKGNIAKDTSGNGNDGTVYGATWVDGKLGKAIKTVNAGDRVETPGFEKLPETSLEFWYMPLATPATAVLALVSDREIADELYMLVYHLKDTKKIRAYVKTTVGINVLESAASLEDYNWYHIVETYDTSKIRLYINGEEDANSPLAVTGTPVNTTNKIFIGADAQYNAPGAIIDEVRVYNKELEPEEIKDLYQYYPSCKPEENGIVKVYDRDFRPYF